jgi:uncharacterized membrane protein YukC
MNNLVFARTTKVPTYSSEYLGYKKKHNVKKYLKIGLVLGLVLAAIYFKG